MITDSHSLSDYVPALAGTCFAFRSPEERERFNHQYTAEARQKAARDQYEHDCPPAYKTFDRHHPGLAPFTREIEEVLHWDSSCRRGILAQGRSGCGKTRAMWNLCRRLSFEEGKMVKYLHAEDFCREVQERLAFGRDDSAQYIDAVAARPILFIDDFGQEGVVRSREDWMNKVWLQLFNRRRELELPLLITTNLSADDLLRFGHVDGEPMVRRLMEIAKPVVFKRA